MKTLFRLTVVLLVIVLTFAACKPKDKENDQKSTSETSASSDDKKVEEEENDTKDDEGELSEEDIDNQEASQNNKDDEPEDDEDSSGLDLSLLDKALLASVKIKIPESSYSVATITSISTWEDEVTETVSTETTYIEGSNSRTETVYPEGTDITIYVGDERTQYNYMLGDSTGYTYVDDTGEMNENELMAAYEGKSLLEFLENEMGFDMELEMKASRDKVAGRDAIFIEMIPAMEQEEGQEFTYQVWIDQEFMHILKYEIQFGSFMHSIQEVTEVEFNLNIDDDLFVPPSDIEFY